MAGNDQHTYGFRKDDADALIAGIGMGEAETPGRRVGATSGEILFGFTLSGDMASDAGAASIYRLNGASTGDSVDGSTVYDPQTIFATLVSGDSGLCIRQGGRYYIIQANCPE